MDRLTERIGGKVRLKEAAASGGIAACAILNCNRRSRQCSRFRTIIERLCELEDKEETMKIAYKGEPSHVKAADLEANREYTYECYTCPRCDKWIIKNESNHYCKHCGQALDWGEE